MTTVQEIVKAIVQTDLTREDREMIYAALKQKVAATRDAAIADAKRTLYPGAIAILRGLSPKYINDHAVKVLAIRNTRAEVQMPYSFGLGKYSGIRTGVPLSCLEVVTDEATIEKAKAALENKPKLPAAGIFGSSSR